MPFVGFVRQRSALGLRVRLRSENVQRMRRRLRSLRALYFAGALEPEEVRSHLCAWLAHARHGHTRSLVREALAQVSFVRG